MSSPSISPGPSSTTDSITSTPTASDSSGAGGGGAPATATLLFGFLVIFAALFAAFLFLAFFWKIQQRRQTAFLPEFDDVRGSNRGVPKLWEVWVRDEPSEKEWNWENTTTTPLSVDVGRVPSEQTVSPTSRSRRPWPYSLVRRRPVRPPRSQAAQQQQQQQLDAPVTVHGVTDADEATTGLISGVRVSSVIMMPHAETPDRRRSEISQVSQVVEQQQNWRRREYAIGIYHPSFREGCTL